jgi:pyrimidine operon attenuation protein/uracil phosphoribosyltransferase
MPIKILTNKRATDALHRIAYQIAEKYFNIASLEIIGVNIRGTVLAKVIFEKLHTIYSGKLSIKQYFTAEKLFQPLTANHTQAASKQNHYVIIDDVLHTGRTLFNVVSYLMDFHPESISIAVLIDRGNHSIPIAADFIGIELATTLQEYVYVTITDHDRTIEAFLE